MSVIKKMAEGLDPSGPDLMIYLNLWIGPGLCYVMEVIEPTDPDHWEKIRKCVEKWTEYWTERDFNKCVWYVVFV